ncbi:hypothetical protein [Streptococcus gordonii]|uniref:hypothetical protein n=1 Tax=Streptococcus gordonii TaxID=1302 RepID=UPI0020013FE5|nr:hypothetical protein [Streptococcus gordonii]
MCNQVNKLASYATYRQLYNDGKKDTYFIISKFIEHIIVTNKLNSFDVEKMSLLLNENFGFYIPSYVIQSAIKRIEFVSKKDGQFLVSREDISLDSEITQELEESDLKSRALMSRLIKYVKDKNREINEEKLTREFTSFLLDDSFNGDYSSIISEFIIENNIDSDFLKNINQIKEGAVLFSGINYTSDISKLTWKNSINLYVETEILFHLAGYNGIFFQKLANDMFQLINEMNQKSNKRIISIRYYKEVSEDIDHFFGTAEEIVKGNKIVDIGNVAMDEIVRDCSTPADVINKRAKFTNILKQYSVSEADSLNYYSTEYHNFNIESQEIVEKYGLATENKEKYLKHLNYTNILRKKDDINSENLSLKESKHLVITEVGKILQMANDFNKENEDFNAPLAISMSSLTNRLWFDLNKGFGSEHLPSTFNILEKSRLVLSNILTQKVAKQYDKVKESYKKGELSEDDLNENIIELRKKMMKPEDIDREQLNNIDDIIKPNGLEIYKSGKERLEKKLKKLEHDNKVRELDRQKVVEEKKRAEKEVENSKKEITRISNERRGEIQERINDIKTRKDNADKKVKGKIKSIRVAIILVFILIVLFAFFLGQKIQFDILVYIITIFPIIGILMTIYTGQKFESLNLINKMIFRIEKYFESKIYEEYNINLKELDKLEMSLRDTECKSK